MPEATGTLKLTLKDVEGRLIKDTVDITLKHQVLSETAHQQVKTAGKTIQINDLNATQTGRWQLTVFPTHYRPVSQFIVIDEGKTTSIELVLPVDPRKIADNQVKFPTWNALPTDLQALLIDSTSVDSFPGQQGQALYGALDSLRRSGLLNLYAKMSATTFAGGRSVFSYLESLTRIRGDRIFADVKKELRDEVKNSLPSELFHEVDGGLHQPPPGWYLVDSFKTAERYGNLQLTFFQKNDELKFRVDADIDDAQGIEHIFQVVGNFVEDKATHPYDIHEILVEYQHLTPGYDLVG